MLLKKGGSVIRMNLRCLIYCIFIFCAVFISGLQSSMLSYVINFSNKIFWGEVFVCILFIASRKFRSYSEFFLAVSMIVIGALSFYTSKSTITITIVLFSLAAKDIDYKKILKAIYLALVCSISFVVIMNQFGFLPVIEFYREGGLQRMSFGFMHPNTFSLYICALTFSYYACKGEAVTIWDSWLVLISIYFTRVYALSYTVSLALMLFLFYILITRLIRPTYYMIQRSGKLLKKISFIGLPILIIVLITLAKNTSSLGILEELGSTVNGRLYFASMGLYKYGISIFGQHIQMYGTSYFATHPNSNLSYFVVDSLYILLLIRDGLLSSICLWGISLASISKCIKSHNWSTTAIMLILYIYSIMETGLSNTAFYFVFIAAFAKVTKVVPVTTSSLN